MHHDAKIPHRFMKPTPASLAEGEPAFFPAACLVIDRELNGWIDPEAVPEPGGLGVAGVADCIKQGKAGVVIRRLRDVYHVDLRAIPERSVFERKAAPTAPPPAEKWYKVGKFDPA